MSKPYSIVGQQIVDKSEDTINIRWTCEMAVDSLWYSYDNGGSWIDVDASGTSGTYTINGLRANTRYNIVTRVRLRNTYEIVESNASEVTTYSFPYCTDTPNFRLGEPVTLKFYNPLGRTFTFYIIANGTQIAQSFACSKESYTGLDEETTVTQLYSTIEGEMSGRYEVRVVYGESRTTRDNGNTYNAIVATANHSLGTVAEDSITVSWSCDQEVDYLWHSVDGGTNWTGADVADGRYGTYAIGGLSPNTAYKVKTRVRCRASQRTTDCASLDATTYDYPHCISSHNFTIGDLVTLNFYNPLGRTFSIYIVANGKEYGAISCSGTSYVGINSAQSIEKLYGMIPDKQSTKYQVRVNYGSINKVWDGGHEYKVDTAVCKPQFDDFNIYDSNKNVTDLVGGGNFVKGLSIPVVTIGGQYDNHMETRNGATPKSYVVIHAGEYTGATYNSGQMSIKFGTFSSSGKKYVTVRACDSRNLFTDVVKEVYVYDYAPPVINVSAKRKNYFEADTTVSISGTVSLLNINGADKNALDTVMYRYREKDGEWGGWYGLTPTIDGDTFTCADELLTLDKFKEYEIEVQAQDMLTQNTVSVPVDIGQAVFFVSSNTFKCYNNGVEIPNFHTMYPVGSVYCSTTNTNPSAVFGGTWELVDKSFRTANHIIYQGATSVLKQFNILAEKSGNTVRLIIDMTTSTAITDATVLGNISDTTFSKLGLMKSPGYYLNGFNGILAVVVDSGTIANVRLSVYGEVMMYSIFNIDGTKTIPANKRIFIDGVVTCNPESMIDSFCNRFYWKRKA